MRGLTALGLTAIVAACGNNGASPATDCKDGETRECYGGPAGTENIGPCRTGLEVCSGGAWPGICIGDVLPRIENCNGLDDDCNMVIDDVDGVGDTCAGSTGCEGVKQCDDSGRVRCIAPSKNECDACGGPKVTNLGDECVGDNGCIGAFACSMDGSFAACTAPVQNECGVCGGPAVTGLTVACASGDGCPGMTVCNADGNAAVCDAPMKNECNACFPSVGTIGATCAGDHGCLGATMCNGTGDATVCTLDASCAHIVIGEVATSSSVCSTDEFIELYNPTSRTVSLTGWTLRSKSVSSGNFTRLVVFSATATIAPHGFFLVASARSSTGCSNSPNPGGGYPVVAGNTVVADATYSAVDVSATNGSIWLVTDDTDPTDENSLNVIDVASFGSPMFQGQNPSPAAGGSIERKANASSTSTTLAAGGSDVIAGNGYDTNTTGDFVSQALRVPQNTSSSAEP